MIKESKIIQNEIALIQAVPDSIMNKNIEDLNPQNLI